MIDAAFVRVCEASLLCLAPVTPDQAAWTVCRGGSRNRNAGLDLAKDVWEKSMISRKNDDYGYEKSFKKSVFTVFVFCKQFKKTRFF